MGVLGDMVVRIRGENQQYNKSIEQSQAKTAKFTKFLLSAAGFAGAVLVLRRVATAVREMERAYAEQVKVETKLRSALRSTGYAVGITADEMMRYATELSRATAIDDEAIVGAEALMVTFTQIGRDVFPQAVEAAADMSVMFGQDLQQSVIQLGTALNDPIQGVGRLRRIGISFTQEQREQIKVLVESNDILGAQKVILDELQVEFGGVAKEMGTTAVAAAENLKIAMGNLKETLGEGATEGLAPFRRELAGLIQDMADAIIDQRNMVSVMNVMGNISEMNKFNLEELQSALEGLGTVERRGTRGVQSLRNAYVEERKILEELIAQKAQVAAARDYATIRTKEEEDKVISAEKAQEEYNEALAARLDTTIDIVPQLAQMSEWETQLYMDAINAATGMYILRDALESQEGSTIEASDAIASLTQEQALLAMDGINAITGINNLQDALDQETASLDGLIDKYREAEEYIDKQFIPVVSNLDENIKKIIQTKREWAQMVASNIIPMFETLGSLMIEQGDAAAKLKAAFKDMIVGILKAIAQKLAILGIEALIPLPGVFNPIGAGAAFAGAAAAAVAAGVVAALETGGVTQGMTPALLHPNEAVLPLENTEAMSRIADAIAGAKPPNVSMGNQMFHVTVNLGNKVLYDDITKATRDGQILVAARAVTP